MTTVAIWNPVSGSAPAEADLQAALGPEVELRTTTEDDPGQGVTRAAVEEGAELIVACGGDGTVRACMESLVGAETALSIVPLGTGNLLASNIGIPAGLDAAAGVGEGTPRIIDVGTVNGEAFAVMAGTGFDALMMRDASSELKSRLGTVAYVISGLKHLRTQMRQTTIDVDGQDWFRGPTSLVLVGNFGSIAGGLEVFPDAEPDDGKLDVLAVSVTGIRGWLSVLGGLALKRPLPGGDRTQGKRIVVTHGRPRVYELDGEDRPAAAELTFDVVAGALTIQHRGE